MMRRILLMFLLWTRVAGAEPVLREDFREVPAHIPVVAADLTCDFLDIELMGPGAELVKLSYHPEVENDPHYLWNGECKEAVTIAFPFDHPLDLSAADSLVRLRCKNFGKSRLHLALRSGGHWIAVANGITKDRDWTVHELKLGELKWKRFDPDKVSLGAAVAKPNLSKIDAIGFAAPVKSNRVDECVRLDWFEVESSSARRQPESEPSRRKPSLLPRGGFIEPETPFLRSALVLPESRAQNKTRRGVLVPLGDSVWGCFDTDLLRWAAFWKAPDGQPPISMDSMAGASYPNARAKSEKPPEPKGELLASQPELPGISPSIRPQDDPRTARLTDGKSPVGPLPTDFGRWVGVSLSGGTTVIHYESSGRKVSEIVSGDADRIERLIRISPGKQALSLRLDPSGARLLGKTQGMINGSGLPELRVAGSGAALVSNGRSGTYLAVAASEAQRVLRVERSKKGKSSSGDARFPAERPAEPLFPDPIEVEGRGVNPEGVFDLRPITLPNDNPQLRAIRPTDLAFLSGGDALLCTFDGDIWRIAGLVSDEVTWTRVATGLFEPTNIEINAKDEVFVLGRDQITQLLDTDGDGHIDLYRNASDAFEQTMHTRDYAMSMALAPDGSFLVAKGGILELGSKHNRESSRHRGTILRISPDGEKVEVLADGLRLPYVGARADGAVFASDQQGNYVPSTPIHLIGKDRPFLGYQTGRTGKKLQAAEPLLWFPYQTNRSGAGFTTLSGKGFPDLDGAFVHVSWNGRLFPVVTPEVGLPFSWSLPLELPFPALNAATHPGTGELFVVGLGISGYNPVNPELFGLMGVRQRNPLVVPESLQVSGTRIRLGFRKPLAEDRLPTVASLRLWDIKRSQEYGSGHFKWNGKPGENLVVPTSVKLGEGRRFLDIEVTEIFRAELMDLSLQLMETGSAATRGINIYARPVHLESPDARDLAGLAKREKEASKLKPGDPKVGKELFTRFACAGCHSMDGQKLTGPPLSGIASRHPADLDAYLRDSIMEPTKVITEGYQPAMPSFQGVIPAQELEDLIAYLKSAG